MASGQHQRNASTNAALARPPVTSHPTAILADKASLTGTHAITLGAGAIVHPFAKLDSTGGPVDIGAGCVIWERAEVGGAGGGVGSDAGTDPSTATRLGENVVVCALAKVGLGSSVGANTTLDVGAVVGSGCALGEWCRLGAMTGVESGRSLADFSAVFYGADGQAERVNVSARDFEKVRSLEAKGRERERENLVKTLGVAKAIVAGKGQ